MKNKAFKLTAVAAALLAISACNSDDNKKSSSAINDSAFKISSYNGLETSDNRFGTWIMAAKAKGSGSFIAADTFSGDKVEDTGKSEAGMVQVVRISAEEGDAIYVESVCGEGDSDTYYKIDENTYQTGHLDFEGNFVSEFNEDGSCADDSSGCGQHTITFSGNVAADVELEEQYENDGIGYIYKDEGELESEGNFYSEGVTDLFEGFGIEEGAGIDIVFEESFEDNGKGGMIKISDADAVIFNADGTAFDGLTDKDDDATDFSGADTATCFDYGAFSAKDTVTTKIDGKSDKLVFVNEGLNVQINHEDGTYLNYRRDSEENKDSGAFDGYEYLNMNSSVFSRSYRSYEDSVAGIETTRGAIFNYVDIKESKGVLTVSGSVESDNTNDMYAAFMIETDSLLNINVSLDTNDVTAVVPD